MCEIPSLWEYSLNLKTDFNESVNTHISENINKNPSKRKILQGSFPKKNNLKQIANEENKIKKRYNVANKRVHQDHQRNNFK